MSKSDLLQDLTNTVDDERSTQRPTERVAGTNCDCDSVTPLAKDMIDIVVTGALNILDGSQKDGKPSKDVLSSANKSLSAISSGQGVSSGQLDYNTLDVFPSACPRRPVMNVRVREDEVCDSVHAEQVAKVIRGLQDIQIGDSAYVLPADGSSIEKQVKRAARNINKLEFGDVETARLIICDGQGDIRTAILEAEVKPPSNANFKAQTDASKVSTCFLHEMIEELEDNDLTKRNSPDHENKEGIANWEESEEQLIQIIEGPNDETGAALLEYQECHRLVIPRQDLLAPDAENGAMCRTNDDSSVQSQQIFSKEGIIEDQEAGNWPTHYLDNYTDEKLYRCTVGLIERVVTTSQHGDVSPGKTTIACKDSIRSVSEADCQSRQIEASNREALSVMEDAGKKSGVKDSRSKLKGRKKSSLGRRLRKFFSRFKSSRHYSDASRNT